MKLNELISANGPSPKQMVEMLRKATYVGIDFGTSTTMSLVSVQRPR